MNIIYKFVKKDEYSKPVELWHPIELSDIQIECLFMDNQSDLYLCRFKHSIMEKTKVINRLIIIKPEDLNDFKKIYANSKNDRIILMDLINIQTYREYCLIKKICDII